PHRSGSDIDGRHAAQPAAARRARAEPGAAPARRPLSGPGRHLSGARCLRAAQGGLALLRHRPRKRATQYTRTCVMTVEFSTHRHGILGRPLARTMTAQWAGGLASAAGFLYKPGFRTFSPHQAPGAP